MHKAKSKSEVEVCKFIVFFFLCLLFNLYLYVSLCLYLSIEIIDRQLKVGSMNDNTNGAETPIIEDCFECKLTGSIVFAGVSLYTLNERNQIPKHTNVNNNLSRRRFLLGLSITFGILSVARWHLDKINFEKISNKINIFQKEDDEI